MTWKNLDYPVEIEEAAVEWRLKINAGGLTPKQEADFARWRAADPRHEDAYDQAITMWSALGTLDRDRLRPSLFQDLLPSSWQRSVGRQSGPHRALRRWALGAAAAAVALVAIGIVSQVWRAPPTATQSAPVVMAYASSLGETKTITLADKSQITLGASTQLTVSMAQSERRISLKTGAAVFDVTPSPQRPFIVDAEGVSAKVLGTVFDVRSSAGVVRLSVSEGSVEVAHPFMLNQAPTGMITRKTVIAGQQISATKSQGLSPVRALAANDFATWRQGRLAYRNATLDELITDANRYSERDIVLSDALKEYTEDRATLIFNGNDIDRLLASLPVLFPVVIKDGADGEVRIEPREPAQ